MRRLGRTDEYQRVIPQRFFRKKSVLLSDTWKCCKSPTTYVQI